MEKKGGKEWEKREKGSGEYLQTRGNKGGKLEGPLKIKLQFSSSIYGVWWERNREMTGED